MKIKKFNINILLSLFTLPTIYSMQNQDECFNRYSNQDIQNLYKMIENIEKLIEKRFKESKETQFYIEIPTKPISISNPFLQNLLESIGYERKEGKKNIYYTSLIIILYTENQKEQYKRYNRLFAEYLKTLTEVILKIRNFNEKIQNIKDNIKSIIKNIFPEQTTKEKALEKTLKEFYIKNTIKKEIEKSIENVFQNPKLNYNTLSASYNDKNYSILHDINITQTLNEKDLCIFQLGMDVYILTIEEEIKKLKIIEKTINNQNNKDDKIIPLPNDLTKVNSTKNQDEGYKQKNIKEKEENIKKQKEKITEERNKNKTPEKFPKERW